MTPEEEYAEQDRDHHGNLQCMDCGRITYGPGRESPHDPYAPRYKMPHSGMDTPREEIDAMLMHVDPSGKTYNVKEAKAAGLPGNISHTYCKECYTKRVRIGRPMEESSREVRRMGEQAERGVEEAKERANRPVVDAYVPVPGSRDPVPGSHEPVPGAHTPIEQPAIEPQSTGK